MMAVPTVLGFTEAEHAELLAGVAAIKGLMADIERTSNESCGSLDGPGDGETESFDGRDYVAITGMIEAAGRRIAAGTPAFRQGACRALADMLTLVADGCSRDFDEQWDPLFVTQPSFARKQLTALGRGAQAT